MAYSKFYQIVASRCLPFKWLAEEWSDAQTTTFLYIHRVTFVANVCSFYYESKALAANFNLHNNSLPLQYFVAAKRSSWSRVVLRLIVDQNEVDRLEAMFNNGVRQITRGNFLSSNLQVASCQFHYFLV